MDRQHRIAAGSPFMAAMHSPICSEASATSAATKNSRFAIASTLSRFDMTVKPRGHGKFDMITERVA
jgi:hypothetical protein